MADQPLLGTVDEHGFIWTVQRRTFVQLYVATGDPQAAARDAKLQDDNPEELLKVASVRQAVQELHDQVLRRIHETDDTILARYSNWAESNIVDYWDRGDLNPSRNTIRAGNLALKDIMAMPRHMQQRIKRWKVKTTHNQHGANTEIELEMHDAMRANDQLAKILGLDSESSDSAQSFAEAIFAFLQEADQLDEHYEDPEPNGNSDQGTESEDGGTSPSVIGRR